ncbi:hypothetical protein HZA42_00455, partial [Candidatus Peregrinibacteria bacterium]|nr:hypothetical protein [Candidatus Peregrinibacteria bacterium]
MKTCHPEPVEGRHPAFHRHPELVSGSKFGFLRDKSGASLMIAIVFVSFFMLVMAGMFEAQLRVSASISNMEAESKAKYLMDSAQEIASYWAATAGVGENFGDLDANGQKPYLDPLYALAAELGVTNCVPASTAADQTPCVSIEVKGRNADEAASKVAFAGASASEYFSAPMKGTGDAAAACGATTADSADDACNWNRLYVGQSVEIPLYYIDASGQPVKLFAAGAGSQDEFRLRMRTPLCAEFGASGTN